MTVKESKEINFDRLSKQEKLRVKLRGRPTPMIQLSRPFTSYGKVYIKRFKEIYFQEKIGYFEVMCIIHYIIFNPYNSSTIKNTFSKLFTLV